jgi:two-component system cell cycle response regulator DivK
MKRILVAEDDAASRELIGELLTAEGYSVEMAADGREALTRLQDGARPDLVLLDIQMPQLDGYEVMRRLRATPGLEGLPVVAFTAYAMAGDSERALAAGFSGYITKPIRVAALREELRKYFS